MRISTIIASMRRGGAERVAAILTGYWSEQGHQVTLLTFDSGETPLYSIDPRIEHHSLSLLAESRGPLDALLRNFRRIKTLRQAIHDSKPDVVVSFMDTTNVVTLIAGSRLGIPVIACEQTDPYLYNIGRVWGTLRRLTYPFADALVCPTNETLARFHSMTRVKGHVIPNIIRVPDGTSSNPVSTSRRSVRPCVIAMGRLAPEKGFDLLLSAFSIIADKHSQWLLRIIGGGPLDGQLKSQANALGLSSRVDFTGEVADPFPMLRDADLFVFSSRFEGFGNALCEAMGCRLPAVSFNCPSGPGSIIREGVDGILVPPENVESLATAMDQLMSNPQERQRLAERAPDVLERFGKTRVMAMWQELFNGLLRTTH
jgi:GalNAc-alpha-(1->4)-GalNAc-alpha-(1->3)-diNAcBac-PP-undecaprenol alpha-1,4-N-acetyl-D-galactosaminyltransferase